MLGAHMAEKWKQPGSWTPQAARLDASSAQGAQAVNNRAGQQVPAGHPTGSAATMSTLDSRCVTQPLQPARHRNAAVCREVPGKRAGGSRGGQLDRENCSSLLNAHAVSGMVCCPDYTLHCKMLSLDNTRIAHPMLGFAE